MDRLTETVHRILGSQLRAGDVAVDATAGNGHDTLFLSETVGPKGKVYAFDVQEAAIEITRARLSSSGLENVELLRESHADLVRFLPAEHHGRVAAITFNLGYLPGSDKTATTKTQTTLVAIDAGLKLLREEGVITVLAYTGHPGGLEEADAVAERLETLDPQSFHVDIHTKTAERAPRLFVVTRRANLG
jgi:predicted methyltransferase